MKVAAKGPAGAVESGGRGRGDALLNYLDLAAVANEYIRCDDII